jgi:hypothetical protein
MAFVTPTITNRVTGSAIGSESLHCAQLEGRVAMCYGLAKAFWFTIII